VTGRVRTEPMRLSPIVAITRFSC